MSCRISSYNGIWLNIFGYYRIAPDHGSVSNFNATSDNHITSDPYIIANFTFSVESVIANSLGTFDVEYV